jgi:hypothetical protein
MFTLVESVKAAKRFVAAKAWDGYVISAFGELGKATTDDQIKAYVRNTGNTIWHAVGTAMMSKKGASYGVVDPDLKVKGVTGLRIVDGSVLVSSKFLLSVRRFSHFCAAFRSKCTYSGTHLPYRRAWRRFDQEGLRSLTIHSERTRI